TAAERALWEQCFPNDPLVAEVHCWNGWCLGYEVDDLYRNYVRGVSIHRAGWPMRAFEGERWDDGGALGGVPGARWRYHAAPYSEAALPLRPRLLGVVVDSVVLGGFAFLVHYVIVLRIARRRQALGRCGGCGHVLLNSETCQECGLRRSQRSFHLRIQKGP